MSKTHRPRLNEQEYKLLQKIRDKGVDFVEDQVHTLEEACANMGVDPDDVKSYWAKGKHYSIFAKNKVKTYEDVRDDIVKELEGYAPAYPEIERSTVSNPHLLVIDPADPHIGKLSDPNETGFEYGIQKAVTQIREGVKALLKQSAGFNIDQILLIIGNDALHIDDPKRTTTAGTPQDTDGMWHHAFHAAKRMYIDVIETLLPVADVHVLYCPSNHDYTHGFFLADTIQSWFANCQQVTFDCSIQHRKYYRYHGNMIEADHGDACKVKDTPMLMATEKPKLWAECGFRYSYKHHLHHKRKIPAGGFDGIGVNIEFLRSSSPPDGWHHRKGFLNIPAIEGFIHSRDEGRIASFTKHFKKAEQEQLIVNKAV